MSEEEEIQRFIELERALEKALRTPGLTTEEKIQLAARELARCPGHEDLHHLLLELRAENEKLTKERDKAWVAFAAVYDDLELAKSILAHSAEALDAVGERLVTTRRSVGLRALFYLRLRKRVRKEASGEQ